MMERLNVVRIVHTERLYNEYLNRFGQFFNILKYEDLVYISGEGIFIVDSKDNDLKLLDGDIIWIGGINSKFDIFARGLAYYFKLKGKIIVDERLGCMLNDDKFSQVIFLDNFDISFPKTLFFCIKQSKFLMDLIVKKLGLPLIVKDVTKDRGEGVFKISSYNELKKFFSFNEGRCFLFQKFIDSMCDYRVIVVNGEVIGSFKRCSKKDFRHNISLGGIYEKVYIDDNIRDIAIKIATGFGLQIAGIDFFIFEDEYFVIEINRLPQTTAFRKLYGDLFDKKVIEMFRKLLDNVRKDN